MYRDADTTKWTNCTIASVLWRAGIPGSGKTNAFQTEGTDTSSTPKV
ncbi:MAG: hypothetical protein Q8904_14305 [Bacteroidota bacterium]|nr:hypothetical protein [Bacteroidota bacterium]